MTYEFSLMNVSIEDYEHGSVKRLMSRYGKVGLKSIHHYNNNKHYSYVWIVKSECEEMAKDVLELFTTFNIL